MSVNVFVGDVPPETTEADLRHEFSRFGTVSSVALFVSFASNADQAFALVEMPNKREASLAMRSLDQRSGKGTAFRLVRPPRAA